MSVIRKAVKEECLQLLTLPDDKNLELSKSKADAGNCHCCLIKWWDFALTA